MLEGQLLDPEDFPWQDSESQVIALGVKVQLHSAVADMVMTELDASINAITMMGLHKEPEHPAGDTQPGEDPKPEPALEEGQ